MTIKGKVLAAAAAFALVAPAAMAQDDFTSQLKARQGVMRVHAISLGVLGGMAQGKIDYDAATAQAAADSLVATSGVSMQFLWPEGTDSMSMEGTRAEPAIWDDKVDFLAKWADFGEAALAMQAAAPQGTEAIGAALRQVGGTCQACHEAYQTPNN